MEIELRVVTAAADSIVWLIRVPGAEYKLQLILPGANSSSGGWIKIAAVSRFQQLGTSYGWLHPPVDSISGHWI